VSWFGILPVLMWLAQSQTPLFLENDGQAMHLKFECTSEDMTAAGLDCTADEPCPVFLELSGIETAGAKLFLTGNLHTQTATLYSILLESTDGARSFAEPEPRMHAVTLDQIQFVDLQTGYISGWTVSPLPRDPFFFVTGDGGKTWNKRFLFEEGKAGAIDQFRFSSPTAGIVLVDTGSGMRHQIYETRDGGSNWALQHESESPIPFPRDRSAGGSDQAWRIRADAKTKTYVLEKQEDNRWLPAARFSISAGVCKG